MDVQLSQSKSTQLGISVVQIVREEYEMILLSRIFDNPLGKKLVFRGGTALRLAYGSQRFSDDLDFSQTDPISTEEFTKWAEKTARDNSNMELVEALKKYFTLFALFKIKDPVLPVPISIKVEISIRKEAWKKDKDYFLMSIRSEVTPLTLLAQVASLTRIKKEKLTIKPLRIRDIFDLWFIGQQLKQPYPMQFRPFSPNEVKRELYRLLSAGARELIKSWLPNG
jgi:predicted nucleotidyltransferase component of viral defense system